MNFILTHDGIGVTLDKDIMKITSGFILTHDGIGVTLDKDIMKITSGYSYLNFKYERVS
jgi:glutamine cyclotransferase